MYDEKKCMGVSQIIKNILVEGNEFLHFDR